MSSLSDSEWGTGSVKTTPTRGGHGQASHRCGLPSQRHTSGFTLVELLAALVLSALVVSALVGLFEQQARLLATQKAVHRATRLADERMREIRSRAFRDPDNPAVEYGPDSGESRSGPRWLFDDVDDYAGWTTNRVVDLFGTVLPDYAGLTETVSVTNVAGTNVNVTVSPSIRPAFKRIMVIVSGTRVRVTRLSVVSEYN